MTRSSLILHNFATVYKISDVEVEEVNVECMETTSDSDSESHDSQ